MWRTQLCFAVPLTAALLSTVVGCGATYPAHIAPSAARSPGPAVTGVHGDVTVHLDEIALRGHVFEPSALGRPLMLLVEEKRPTSLDALRGAFRDASDLEARRVIGQALATALYEASRKTVDAAGARELREEARQALVAVRTAADASSGASEVTLQMLAVLEIADDDYAGAADALAELATRFPAGRWTQADRVWRALCAIRLHRNDAAMAAVADAKPTAAEPETAYVLAWARWRTGDRRGAISAMTTALQGWKVDGTRRDVVRELVMMLARSDAPSSAAVATIISVADGTPPSALIVDLGDAYAMAGRWQDAVAALDVAAAQAAVEPATLARMRALQAQYVARALDGPRAAELARQAVDALTACGSGCDAARRDEVASAVHDLALYFHTLYSRSLDARLLAPDRALYALYARLQGRPDGPEMRRYAEELEVTARRARAAATSLERSSVAAIVSEHAQEIEACYEAALSKDPNQAGRLVLHLRYAASGEYTDGSSEPAAGQDGVSAIARCALRAAATWRVPQMSSKRATRIEVAYRLSPAS